jgi:hypothetical protein
LRTADPSQRAKLKTDYDALGKIERDERIVGFNTVYDRTGGFVGFPLISDVQDEQTRDELIKMGLSKRDAEHISQALSNDCDQSGLLQTAPRGTDTPAKRKRPPTESQPALWCVTLKRPRRLVEGARLSSNTGRNFAKSASTCR